MNTPSAPLLSRFSIRSRLLFAYVGILLLGFVAVGLVTGSQIAASARSDYEQRLRNEARLIAQGIQRFLDDDSIDLPSTELRDLLEIYEGEINGDINLIVVDGRAMDNPGVQIRLPPELEAARRGDLQVVAREGTDGQVYLFTATSIGRFRFDIPLIQLQVPLENLQSVIVERWVFLWGIFAAVLILAVLAALLLSRSILVPLSALRESAARIARGELDHRVQRIGRDEIGQVARTFNEMADQVQSMLEEQRAFASNTSHELRTPLTTIRLRSEALRYDETLDDAERSRYVLEIDNEVRRLGTLVEDLTLLSRFDAGRAELGQSEIDFGRFAAGLVQQMQRSAGEKHISIETHLPDSLLTVHASLSHLTVVFRNLLDNAIKYTPEGGHIQWTISASSDSLTSIISDTGQGIDSDHLPRIFERFYRADKARSREIPGTGLGLALVKSILDAYGASIGISSPGSRQGTTVTVIWPLA